MRCPTGHENPDEAAFCMVCGAPLETPSGAEPHSPDNPEDRTTHPVPRRRGLLLGVIAALAVAGVLIAVVAVTMTGGSDEVKADDAGLSGSGSSSASETPASLPLRDAFDFCSMQPGYKTLTLGDEGRTLIIDTQSEYGPMGGLSCVLGQLATSQAVVAQLENTTSMMGVQQAEDGTLHYQFSYHPDNGVNMVITDLGSD